MSEDFKLETLNDWILLRFVIYLINADNFESARKTSILG